MLLSEAGPDYPDLEHLSDDLKFGRSTPAEIQSFKHNWTLRGTITEEQGEMHNAQGKTIGGSSSREVP